MKETFILLSVSTGIILATFLLAYIANRFMQRIIRKATEDMSTDPTNYKFLRHIILASIYIIGFCFAIYNVPTLRTFAGSILAGAGIIAVAVGFASQQALSNVVSGVFIILFKPFRINDRLTLRTFNGIVEDITLRHTVIRDFENKRIIVPNSIISDEIIINSDFADEKICRWVDIGISYSSNIDLAKSIIAEEIIKHPLHIDPRTEENIAAGVPEAVVRVIGLLDSSVQLRGFAWAKDGASSFVLFCDLLESIKKRFDNEGIEIPFPHRTVFMRSADENRTDEVLQK